ncbi:hypothetical protein IC235_02555 [Hymenobacter sp. BT664]|uniref:Uncharacterized protein n=1 Tax=Hymenobacter montanus TaxID=2771359 RepID=A0A927BAK8_9BACT|nr:hypothetical protein [Hymenobacter montanus]MBD2766770.1 hypothetical protein [Hymenobacter montanus]
MSYDLYFFKHKTQQTSEKDISIYLTANLCPANEQENQWFYENDDTEVYFSFDLNKPETDPETTNSEIYPDFDDTRFSFNLNFIRPDFFGQEAFLFVDQMIGDLGLYVLNPQTEEYLMQPAKGELYKNWSEINARISAQYYGKSEFNYYPLPASNAVWKHNFNRRRIQAQLGSEYFVPKVMVFQAIADRRIITIAVWPESLPIQVPQVDYYFLVKRYQKLFEKVEESGLISTKTFQAHFENFIRDSDAGKIIHPADVNRLHDIFNSIKFDEALSGFAEKLPYNKMVNFRPKDDEEEFSQESMTVLD